MDCLVTGMSPPRLENPEFSEFTETRGALSRRDRRRTGETTVGSGYRGG